MRKNKYNYYETKNDAESDKEVGKQEKGRRQKKEKGRKSQVGRKEGDKHGI